MTGLTDAPSARLRQEVASSVEPATLIAGVTAVGTERMHDEQALRELYAASYPRLVGVVGAVCGSAHEAEEAVQDAFVRLMSQWTKVARYDDPEAWVRKVALGYASNRRRKALNGI